jgi:hypothetical protein
MTQQLDQSLHNNLNHTHHPITTIIREERACSINAASKVQESHERDIRVALPAMLLEVLDYFDGTLHCDEIVCC